MTYSSQEIDRTWGIWGFYDNIPEDIFDLLKADYSLKGFGVREGDFEGAVLARVDLRKYLAACFHQMLYNFQAAPLNPEPQNLNPEP